ncbi:MAG: hypothetical protein AAFZ65_07800 [Planctomycetota bacterium]
MGVEPPQSVVEAHGVGRFEVGYRVILDGRDVGTVDRVGSRARWKVTVDGVDGLVGRGEDGQLALRLDGKLHLKARTLRAAGVLGVGSAIERVGRGGVEAKLMFLGGRQSADERVRLRPEPTGRLSVRRLVGDGPVAPDLAVFACVLHEVRQAHADQARVVGIFGGFGLFDFGLGLLG